VRVRLAVGTIRTVLRAGPGIALQGIKARLGNIRSVEPILGAMRTIALGSWQAALHRQAGVRLYSQRLAALLPLLTSHLGSPKARSRRGSTQESETVEVLVIGSERGLCGAFNSSLIQYVGSVLAQYASEGRKVRLAALGARAQRGLEREGQDLVWSRSLPMTTLPSTELANELTLLWLRAYEERDLDAVDVIYNAYRSSSVVEPVTARLIPPPLPAQGAAQGAAQDRTAASWPPPYIDTDPVDLYTRLIRLWTTTEAYRILLDSAAAEHSARYQLMEGATQNAQHLVSELTLALQAARQQAITAEMQDLAVGAGLLGPQQ
jgi:F-type H+-transporting ATPase subunit gamma